ncbi:thiamine pyrophosphate-dependent enzyme [Actinomycetota bacterium]
MTGRTAGHAIVEQLAALDITHAHLVPGESYLDVLDGLHGSAIDAVVCRHEGGAAFMAMAHARLTGGVGVAMVTRGPGAANAAIGVHTAYQDGTPLVLFVGLIPVADRDRESFQEFSLEGWFGTTAKRVFVLDDATRAAAVTRDAVHAARSGRPGPVVVGLPEDVLVEQCDQAVLPARALPVTEHTGSAADLAAELASAQRPLVVVGGDLFSQKGSDDLRRWVEAWGLPVVSDFRAHDKLDHDSPSWCGFLGYGRADTSARLLDEADHVVFLDAVNSDVLSDGYRLGDPDRSVTVVGLEPRLLAHDGRVDRHLLAHPDALCAALAETASPDARPWTGWVEQARAGWVEFATPQPDGVGDGVDMGALMAALVPRLERDAVVTYGAGNHAIWAQRYLPSHACPSVLAPRNGAMGFGVPAAVAAAIAEPGRRVVTVAGDGCFLMNGQELAVASARGARVLAIVMDNGQYGTIRAHQEAHYPGRVSGTQLANPDFALLAQGYGGLGITARTTDEAVGALDELLAHDGVTLLHVVADPAVLAPVT